jgi:hypothetical protein
MMTIGSVSGTEYARGRDEEEGAKITALRRPPPHQGRDGEETGGQRRSPPEGWILAGMDDDQGEPGGSERHHRGRRPAVGEGGDASDHACHQSGQRQVGVVGPQIGHTAAYQPLTGTGKKAPCRGADTDG